jgi:transposase
MQVLYPRCAGIDVHKQEVLTTVMITHEDGKVEEQTRAFPTMTADLLALDEWLASLKVEVVAMESTGVYWRPVFNLLEDGRTIILVNAQHMKAVPGRKTDIKDSQWLADLLRHGLLQASFIPPAPIRELRDLTRYRKTLVQERAQEVNRLQKVLETANLKLASVVTDVLGKSGRLMLDALLEGERDPEVLAELARGSLRGKLPALRQALDGRLQPHHQVLISQILAHIDFLEESLAKLQEEIETRLVPFEEAVSLIESLPVRLVVAAAVIVSEIGVDRSRFPSEKHISSWAGLSPGNKVSAGKRLSGKTTKGNVYLRAVLCQVAWALVRAKDNYFAALYHRIARRRGKKRALLAVAHSLLVVIYHMLRTKKPYSELGADYFDKLETDRIERQAVRRLEQLGYHVALTPKEVA